MFSQLAKKKKKKKFTKEIYPAVNRVNRAVAVHLEKGFPTKTCKKGRCLAPIHHL